MNTTAIQQDTFSDGTKGSAQVEAVLEALKNATNEGPGKYLKQLRELHGASEVEVASRLNIGIHQVRALEADDYENLPAPIFVRNFLRRYSEFLQISVDLAIDAYERFGHCEQPTLARVSLRERLNTRNSSMRWATYTAILLLVGLVAYWWQTTNSRIDVQPAALSTTTPGGFGEQQLLLPVPEMTPQPAGTFEDSITASPSQESAPTE